MKRIKIVFSILFTLAIIGIFSIFASASTNEKIVNININGTGDVSIYVNGVYRSDAPAVLNVEAKSTIKLVATSENFLFFADSSNNTVGTENEASFLLMSDTTITANFENTSNKKVTVYYRNSNDTHQVLRMATFGATQIESALTSHLVSVAYKNGYVFMNWDKSVDAIVDEAMGGAGTVIVEPHYEASQDLYSFSAQNATVYGANVNGKYLANTVLTLVAYDPNVGEKFAYWTNGNGQIVSESKIITIKISGDDLYRANYIFEEDNIQNLASVEILSSYDPTSDTILLSGHRFVPSGDKLQTYGLIYAKEQNLTENSLTLDAVNGTTIKATAISNFESQNGFFTNRISFNEMASVRAYIIYLDVNDNVKTVYSDVLLLKYPELNNLVANNQYRDYVSDIEIPVNYNVNKKIDFCVNFNISNDERIGDLTILKNVDEKNGNDLLVLKPNGDIYFFDSKLSSFVKTEANVKNGLKYKFELQINNGTGKSNLYINDLFIKEISFSSSGEANLVVFPNGNEYAKVDTLSLSTNNKRGIECEEHNYVEKVVAPNCVDNGYSLFTCAECGVSYRGNYVSLTGVHHYLGTIDSTGIDYKCSVCNKTEHKNISSPYSIVYDDGNEDIAYDFSVALSKKVGYQLPIVERTKNINPRYVDIDGVSLFLDKYGYSIEGTKITLYRGAFVEIDTLLDRFVEDIANYSFSTLPTSEYCVNEYKSGNNYKEYSYFEEVLLSKYITNEKEKIKSNNTDISEISGTVYYVSSNGSDENTGVSDLNPLKTIDKVNELINGGEIKANDAVLFERGGVFRLSDTSKYLEVIDGITFGSYGDLSKEMPIITSSRANYALNDRFISMGNNIWKLDVKVFNPGVVSFTDMKNVEYFGNKKMTYKDGETVVAGNTLLKQNFDYFFGVYDATTTSLDIKKEQSFYIYYDKNPNFDILDIEISENYSLFYLNANENVVVDGLSFRYFGSNVICGNGTDITVKNCEFYAIGSSIYDYKPLSGVYTTGGYVIDVCDGLTNVLIKNNIFNNTQNGAIKVYAENEGATFDNVLIESNIIEKANKGIEYYSTVELAKCDFTVQQNVFSNIGTSTIKTNENNNCFALKIGGLASNGDTAVLNSNVFNKTYLYGLFGDEDINNRQTMIQTSNEALNNAVFFDNSFIFYLDQYIAKSIVDSTNENYVINNLYFADENEHIDKFFNQVENTEIDSKIIRVEHDKNEGNVEYDIDKDLIKAILG